MIKTALPILTNDDLRDAIERIEAELGRKIEHGRNTDHGGVSLRTMDVRLKHGILGKLGEIAMGRWGKLATNDRDENPTSTDFLHRRLKLETRTTEWDYGHCIVYRKDDDDKFVMLVTGSFPQMYYRGAIRAGDAKQVKQWWQANRDPPCWFVPQSVLREVNHILGRWSNNGNRPKARGLGLRRLGR